MFRDPIQGNLRGSVDRNIIVVDPERTYGARVREIHGCHGFFGREEIKNIHRDPLLLFTTYSFYLFLRPSHARTTSVLSNKTTRRLQQSAGRPPRFLAYCV
jgi:hypothetical protein